MHILVTGGAGFIGSNLCRKLLSLGHSVECIDNLYTGKLDNIEDCQENDGFSFVEHDVTQPYVPNIKPDQIYNMACPASPRHYQATPIDTTLTNVLGAYHLLELARSCDATILQASTSEVYGDPDMHPQPESYTGNVNPIGIRACYDEGKRVAESLFFDFNRSYGTRIKVARIFNTYGPFMCQDDGRVISNFIIQALFGKPLTIYGDGSQTRSFCYVDDLVEGLIAFMSTDADVTGPMNFGSQYERTMLEIAELVLRETRSASELSFLGLPADDPRVRRPDTTFAETALGWRSQVSLEEGLSRTIAYFETILNEEN